MTEYDDLCVLFCYHGHALHYEAPMLGGRMVVCGPYVRPGEISERRLHVQCSPTAALTDVVAGLDRVWRPDVAVIRVDASSHVRVSTAGLGCPVVLLLGDTHHLAQPIQGLIDYVKSVAYDYAFAYNNLRHVHFLLAAGLERIRWTPGLLVTAFDEPFREERFKSVCAVGNLLQAHAYRRRLVGAMFEAGLPVTATRMDARRAAEAYASAAVSFNCSLNGDLNMRVFEILSSGGLLLTDRLSPLSGLDDLFEEGRDYVAYAGAADLVNKCRYYLAHPEQARSIAGNGRARYDATLAAGVLLPMIWRLVFEGREDSLLEARRDPRIGESSALRLDRRISVYQDVQERHREQDACRVLALPSVPDGYLQDLCDLPRLELFLVGASEGLNQRLFTAPPVRVGPEALEQEGWSLVMLSREEFQAGRFADGEHLLIWDVEPEDPRLTHPQGELVHVEGYANLGVFKSSSRSAPVQPGVDTAPVRSLTCAIRSTGPAVLLDTAGFTILNVQVIGDPGGRISLEASNNSVDWVTLAVTPTPDLAYAGQQVFISSVGMFEASLSCRYVRIYVHERFGGEATIACCLKKADMASTSTRVANTPYVLPANRCMFFEEEVSYLAPGQASIGLARDVGVGAASNCVWKTFLAVVTSEKPGTAILEGAGDGVAWRRLQTRRVDIELAAQLEAPILMRYYRVRFENDQADSNVFWVNASFAT